ncbi:MAG TPA: hypothetical protein VHK69_12510 [Chitinophagaceae bacterium]|jgi:hypothetical protein|nr:hypothetical protein [Chitinophagaceae bacterium]
MKRRITKVLNFFAFNLLFFALYLNFIHKDNSSIPPAPATHSTSSVKGTVVVEHPEIYMEKSKASAAGHTTANHAGDADKLTFN